MQKIYTKTNRKLSASSSIESPLSADDLQWKKECDQLFQRFSIPELRIYEQKRRDEVNKKKEELRSLVGERYRDLIDAADTIISMKDPVNEFKVNMDKLKNLTSKEELEKKIRISEDKVRVDQDQQTKFQNFSKLLLLQQSPAHIRHSIEKSRPLISALVYLISKETFRIARDTFSTMPESEIYLKHVVDSWGLIERLKVEILETCQKCLSSFDGKSDQDLSESMIALMILGNNSISDVLKHFFDIRRLAMYSVDSKDSPVDSSLLEVINLFKLTLLQVNRIFTSQTHEISYFQDIINSIIRGDSELISNRSKPTSFLSAIYGYMESNVDLYIPYLPIEIKEFSFVSPPDAIIDDNNVYSISVEWATDMEKELQNIIQRILESVKTGCALYHAQNSLWKNGHDDLQELWLEVSKSLFGESYDMWATIILPCIENRFHSIVTSLLNSLLLKGEETILRRFQDFHESDAGKNIRSIEIQLDSFLWNPENYKNFQKIRCKHAPSVIHIMETIETELENVAIDLQYLCDLDIGINEKNVEERIMAFKHQCFDSFEKFATILHNLADSGHDCKDSTKALFIGQCSLSFIHDSKLIPATLCSVSAMFPEKTSQSIQSHILLERWEKIKLIFEDVSDVAFGFWIKYLAEDFHNSVRHYLVSEALWNRYSELLKQSPESVNYGPWEFTTITLTDDQQKESVDKILIPSQPSYQLTLSLKNMASKCNQAGLISFYHHKTLVNLVSALLKQFLFSVEALLSMEQSIISNERLFLQIYFDLEFGWKMLQSGSTAADDENNLYEKFSSLKLKTKALIDPIEFSIVERQMQQNVEKCYFRVRNLFHVFTQLNTAFDSSKYVSRLSDSFATENHNIISISTLTQKPITSPISASRDSDGLKITFTNNDVNTYLKLLSNENSSLASKQSRGSGIRDRDGSFGKITSERALAQISSMLGQYF